MNIFVNATQGAPIKITPDPATVTVGEEIVWNFYYDGSKANFSDPIEWTIYFSGASPFKEWKTRNVRSDPEGTTHQKGRLEGGSTLSSGEYKYGVRVSNARTTEVMSDDDPKLIVQPHSR